jgi:hypothetical protein
VAADTLLAEEHRARRVELDDERDGEQQRGQQQQRDRGAHDVEQPLGHRLRACE